jgi:hypothetical protein
MEFKGRVTAKKLVEWINKKFIELEINDIEVYEVVPTRFNSDQMEGGAAALFVRFRNKDYQSILSNGTFYCFHPMWDIKKHLDLGYKLVLKLPHGRYTYSSLELGLEK